MRNINIPSLLSYSIRLYAIINIKYLKCFWKKLSYFYITFFIFFTFPLYAQELISINGGTTVIGVVRNDTIWIGADSKMESGEFICKIVKTDSMIFTHAGIYNEWLTQFNVDTLFVHCVQRSGDIRQARSWFNYAMKKILQLHGSLRLPGSIKYKIGDKIWEDETGCLIATYLDGNPIVYTHHYLTTVLDNNLESHCQTRTDVSFESYIAQKGSWRIFSYGYDKLIRNAREDFSNWDIPTLINYLIGLEIGRTPRLVGKPISIIRITKDGIDWVDGYKGLCDQ